MTLPNGYEMTTTFYDDFSIADGFGIPAIKDTYKRAFGGWKKYYIYLTELVIALNYKCWYWNEKNEEYARLYSDLWEKADLYARENLKGDELKFFYETTD